jgi:glucan biosynthesis protein C
MNTQLSDTPVKPQRRWDIDWLRVLAVLLLFPLHTARIFDIWEEFYVKNAQTSNALSYMIAYLGPWHMPLFFLLAGASTWFALRFRSGGVYARERFKRLLVPFIFGVLVLIPPQSYLGLRSHSGYAESFWHWFPRFFQIVTEDPEGYLLGGHTWAHLWFIAHLLLYSLLALPLFLYLSRDSGQRLIKRLAAFCTRPGLIFLFAIPLLLTLSFPDIAGGNPLFYILIFIYGYVLMADARFGEAIDRHKAVAFILGPAVLVAIAYFKVTAWPKGIPDWSLSLLSDYGEAFIPWFCLIALLGYGKQFLNFSNKFLKYTAEASYPIYILHQTVIVMIGFYVVQWGASAALGSGVSVGIEFLTIMLASLGGTVLVYDLLVKRTNVTRFLFAMRPKKQPSASPAPRPQAKAA